MLQVEVHLDYFIKDGKTDFFLVLFRWYTNEQKLSNEILPGKCIAKASGGT
jgi:hypothetical protein